MTDFSENFWIDNKQNKKRKQRQRLAQIIYDVK